MAHRNRATEGVVLTREMAILWLLKAEQLPLFSPVDRYLRCQSHQPLGG